jgi:glycosyltransferase involved in cell wall biosynthesis
MTTPSKQDIASLNGSGLFDAEQYRSTYPDVDILGMDPTEHYLKYGRFLGRMSVDGDAAKSPNSTEFSKVPATKLVGAERQHLSVPTILDRRTRYAGVATTANRLHSFEQAFQTIAAQVDTVHVYLNGHAHVPSFLRNLPQIRCFLSSDHDDLGDAGKFFSLPALRDGYYLSFDDDIAYPSDYADRLIKSNRDYDCPVGVHGSLLRRDTPSYYRPEGRYNFHFKASLDRDIPVDILGTGTLCFDLDRSRLRSSFDYRNMADLWAAEAFARDGTPLICVHREEGWLRPLDNGTVSVWDANRFQPTVQKVLVEHKSEALASVARAKSKSFPRIFIGIKTYNRVDYLRQCLTSIMQTLEPGFDYVVAVADDGSDDGTNEYLSALRLPIDLSVIRNRRRYASGQFNELVDMAMRRQADFMFILDDDVVFRKSGWVSAYRQVALESGYHHLCHYNLPHHAQLAPNRGVDPSPTELESSRHALSAYGSVEQAMGALMTLTPEVVDGVGQADEANFSVRGQWHVDFSARACRAGFNEYNRFFDLRGSNEYIELQNTVANEYKTSIPWTSDEFKHANHADEVSRRKSIVRVRDRIHSTARPAFVSVDQTARAPLTVNDVFDRVFVLNLDRRPDRLALIDRRLSAIGVRFERFCAHDGQSAEIQAAYAAYAESISNFAPSRISNSMAYYQGDFSTSEQARYFQSKSNKPAIRSAGAWAYLLGYRDILMRTLQENWGRVLILDDDCQFHVDFGRIFARVAADMPQGWRTLHLGTLQYHHDRTERYCRHLDLPHGCIVGSHAVGYQAHAIPEILNRIDMMNLPFDVGPLQQDAMHHRDQTFVISPNLAIQDNTASDINSSDCTATELKSETNRYGWRLQDYSA